MFKLINIDLENSQHRLEKRQADESLDYFSEGSGDFGDSKPFEYGDLYTYLDQEASDTQLSLGINQSYLSWAWDQISCSCSRV